MNDSEGFPHYYDYYPEWVGSDQLESVPGFGFLPVGVNKELDMMTQVMDTNLSNLLIKIKFRDTEN